MNEEQRAATQILCTLDERAPEVSAEALAPLVYEDLRRLAAGYLNGRARSATLQPTALVHEAFLRLVDQSRVDWRGRTHFLAVGAMMLRRVLVDSVRASEAAKRGGEFQRITLNDAAGMTDGGSTDFEEIERALGELASVDPRAARVVELRFFAGMTEAQIAEMLGITDRTVRNDWRAARAWLRTRLGDGAASAGERPC